MLKTHLDGVETFLLAYAKIQETTGHSLHKGTPREFFVNEFLREHLSDHLAIGTGEIIDADSKPGQRRNQIDIVLYKRDYPKLAFGGGINGFLVESVVATIEVKSTLTKEELSKAYLAARNVKRLKPNTITAFTVGNQPPGILSFLVAYNGPAKMATASDWIPSILSEHSIAYPALPPAIDERIKIPAPSLDAICVLGKGMIYFDNAMIGLLSAEARQGNPNAKWVVVDMELGTLLLLFLLLTNATCHMSGSWLNPVSYVQQVPIPNICISVRE
jgi:hypothetical protein